MQIDYKILSSNAKVFLFPSSRKFYTNEIEELKNQLTQFTKEFDEISIAFKISYNRFLLFFVDENIPFTIEQNDDLVQFIQQLEEQYKITLLDRVNICFKQGEFVQYQEMKKFRDLIKKRSVSKKTIVFNNFIQTKYDFENDWEIPLSESWLAYLFK